MINDAHALVTIFMEWRACLIEELGDVPCGFDSAIALHLLTSVTSALEDARLRADDLARDASTLKEFAK